MTVRKNDKYAIANGHPPVAHGVIAVDFDATIVPWGKTLYDVRDALPGAVEAINAFKDAGLTIVIFTSRMSQRWWDHEGFSGTERDKQRMYVEGTLTRLGIPFDDITAEKVPAIAYIDDKAIEFTGNNWDEIQKRVLGL